MAMPNSGVPLRVQQEILGHSEGNRFHQEWGTFWKNNCAEIPGLSRLEARELVQKSAELHGWAYRWDAQRYMNGLIDALVSDWHKRQRPVGELVRVCVAMLDAGESQRA